MTPSTWTDDRVGRLKTLWLEGRSAEWIARDLAYGITRSAVLGKVHRMGLSAARPSAPPGRAKPTVAEDRRRRPRATAVVAEDAAPQQGSVSLLAVRRGECRWPFGDPVREGFSLCGKQVSRGAYCADHARVAYRQAVGETLQALERLSHLT